MFEVKRAPLASYSSDLIFIASDMAFVQGYAEFDFLKQDSAAFIPLFESHIATLLEHMLFRRSWYLKPSKSWSR